MIIMKCWAEIAGFYKKRIEIKKIYRDQEDISILVHAIKKGRPCQVTLRNYRKDGTLFWNELTVTPIRNEQDELTHFIGVQNDVTDRRKDELFKDHIRKVLEMIAQHMLLKNIGKEIVKTMESSIEGGMASILVLDAKRKTLHKLVAPNLPKPFKKAIEDVAIGANAGSCGAVAHLKKEVVVADVAKDRRGERIQCHCP